MSYGLDVSHWNGAINFAEVKNSGKEFVYIKSSEGGETVDSRMDANLAGFHGAGISTGLYHFANAAYSPTANALLFSRIVSRLGIHNPGYLPPCLDFEIATTDDMSWVLDFWHAFDVVMPPMRKMLYADSSWFRAHDPSRISPDVSFWVASWGSPVDHPTYMDGRTLLHQYTNSGRVSGVVGKVDLDFALVPVAKLIG